MTDIFDNDFVSQSLDEKIVNFEKELIQQALIKNNWNQSKTARSLKVSIQTLRYKMNKLGLKRS